MSYRPESQDYSVGTSDVSKGRSKESVVHMEDVPGSSTEDVDDLPAHHYTRYPNRWSRIRYVPLEETMHDAHSRSIVADPQ